MESPCGRQGGFLTYKEAENAPMNSLKWSNAKKTLRYLKRNGIWHTYYAVRERVEEEKKNTYCYTLPKAETLERQREQAQGMPWKFSIVVPLYETPEEFLREMLASVCRQSYPHWELILADAGRTDKALEVLNELTGEEREKILYLHLEENRGISENTNEGIRAASGDYAALLDHDDLLAPDALYHMAETVREAEKAGEVPELIYTDEDKYDDGIYFQPNIKENFNLDLILSNNYICHFTAVKRERIQELLLRAEYDGAQDYDLVLRVVSSLLRKYPAAELHRRIRHVPRVLYHWRCHEASTAQNTASKSYAYEAGRRALADFCRRQGLRAQVEESRHLGFYRICYQPDLLTERKDAGLLGGRLLDERGRICGGMYDAEGNCLYEGLPGGYSGGSTHRAALRQDCAAVDIRCLQVREELHSLYREIIGLPYREREIGRGKGTIRCADLSGLSCNEAGYRELSLRLSNAVSERGYLIVWDPEMSRRR